MKKVLVLSAGLLLGMSVQQINAQSTRFGVKIGANYSTLYIPSITRPERLLGLAVGGFAQIALTEDGFFFLQPEALYSAKGAKSTFQGTTYQQRYYYVDVPVLAKINARGAVFEAGPQGSFLLGRRVEAPNGTSTDVAQLNRVSLGAVVGVGYQSTMGLGITLRYANDLSRIISGGGERNTLYQLQLGYLFGAK